MRRLIFLTFLSILFMRVYAQQDSLVLMNNDSMIGEVKGMSQGVLKIETDYSDADFAIEWDGIKSISTETYFLITLSDGRRFNGKINSTSDLQIEIITLNEGTTLVSPESIVFMESVDRNFWSKMNASIDFGWDLTKANNLRQASLRSNLGYRAEMWSINTYYNAFTSNQDSVSKVSRNDAGVGFRYYFQRNWFSGLSTSFLSNTEQKILLRTNGKLGAGTYIIQTNAAYWNISIGASFNSERYENSADDRQSLEGFLDTEVNLFDTGDLSLRSKIALYPGITESGRWRSDFNFDIKYDLPKDFYIKLGITLNYDNRPVEGASESDYVFATGFGWEL
ncbi:DUF481 domain-containing protein [Carboxylicivirga mesophila]|uniref:DUF481 domain-containing protein n=1 Tax=Carboxylicivirga mesophila TaxID=1166478 RepID=A0ABS5K6X3_9BACT|nr:DUF481 domain-containing protein [Carboxylicivirga mesophila]MBS2210256.1 DUF481 domain-containing protein [Carboxylicivirga mesophila]